MHCTTANQKWEEYESVFRRDDAKYIKNTHVPRHDNKFVLASLKLGITSKIVGPKLDIGNKKVNTFEACFTKIDMSIIWSFSPIFTFKL